MFQEDEKYTEEHIPESLDSVNESNQNLSALSRFMEIGSHAVRSSIIYLEATPTNGIIRYGAFGVVLAATKDPVFSGVVLGASTLALEGGAAVATASVLSSSDKYNTGIRLVDRFLDNKYVKPLIVSKEGKLHKMSECLLALYTGTVITMTAKENETEIENRNYQDRRNYGLKIAGLVGAICTAQGVLYGEGLTNVDNPKVIIPVASVVVGTTYGMNKLKRRLKNMSEELQNPNYQLSEEELRSLEHELVETVQLASKNLLAEDDDVQKDDIYATWLPSTSKFTNILRTHEASYFPEVAELPIETEANSTFLAMVDTRPEYKRVVHATTVSGIDSEQVGEERKNGRTGFITIDDLIEEGNFTSEEFLDYYKNMGIDLNRSFSVDTNYRIGEKTTNDDGLSSPDLAYLTLFQLLRSRTLGSVTTAIFASINKDSIDSFKRIGLEYEPLMGRTDLVTSESREGKDFLPVMLPWSKSNRDLFKSMDYTVVELDLR